MASGSDPPNPAHNTTNYHGSHNYGYQFGQAGPIYIGAHRSAEDRARELVEGFAGPYRRLKDDPNPKRVAGTCAWFINDERFSAWRDADDARLLHVFAKPGCGKSVLARALVDESLARNPQTSAVLYFFFKAGNTHASCASSALTSMVHQLYSQHPQQTMSILMLPKYASYGKSLSQELGELWDMLIDICNTLDTNITCIIDAVDECEEPDRRSLLSTISAFYSSNLSNSTKLKCLVTSRPYREIDFEIDTYTYRTTFIRFDGDEKTDEIAQEIKLVIQANVPRVMPLASASTKATIIRYLQDMQNRTYLWLHLILHYIKGNISFQCTESKLIKLLQAAPLELHDMYESLLSRFSNPEHSNHSLSRTLFAITLAAERPLTLQETQIALAISEDSSQLVTELYGSIEPREAFKKSVLELSGHLLIVQGDLVYFLHQTVREFLLHNELESDATIPPDTLHQGAWKQSITISNAHGTLYGLCIRLLTLKDPWQSSDGTGISIDKIPYPHTPPISDPALLEYALQHWPTHWNCGTNTFQQESFPGLFQLLHDFENRKEFWWRRLDHFERELDDDGLNKWQLMARKSLNTAFEWSVQIESARMGSLAKDLSTSSDIDLLVRDLPAVVQHEVRKSLDKANKWTRRIESTSVKSFVKALCAAAQDGSDYLARLCIDQLKLYRFKYTYFRNYYQKLSTETVPRLELGECWAVLKVIINFLGINLLDINFLGTKFPGTYPHPSDSLIGTVIKKKLISRTRDSISEDDCFKFVQQYLKEDGGEKLVRYVNNPTITPIEQRVVLETILKYPTPEGLKALLDHYGTYSSYAWQLCLKAAQRFQQPEIAKFLLENHPSNFDLHTYNTVMWTAARCGDRAFVAQLLVFHPMDITGQEALNDSSTVTCQTYDQLLDMCVGRSDIERYGFISDAIYTAATKGRIKTLESLLEYSLMKGMRPGFDLPLAMEVAARENHVEVIERLLRYYQSHGNLPESSYRAALHYADVNDHKEVLSLLLDRGPPAFREQYLRFYASPGSRRDTNDEDTGPDNDYDFEEPWSSGDDNVDANGEIEMTGEDG